MGSNNHSFDFVIVGGGTAGCILAHSLATAASKPSILLVEVGGLADDEQHRPAFQRFLNAFMRPDLDQGYTTIPQVGVDGKELPYTRGKGLGGSSLSNFMVWTRGSSADFDRWAELVGSDDWAWKNVAQAFKKASIERFSAKVPKDLERWAKPDFNSYGEDGYIPVSLPPKWEKEMEPSFEAMQELGYPLNLDLNSGDPIGYGFSAVTLESGSRSTSGSALRSSIRPPNLTVWTEARASKIIFSGKKAIGVQIADGRTAIATKEILLTAGTVDTAKLLLLSGVGPAGHLAQHNIPLVHELPGVGQNVQDHVGAFMAEEATASYSDRASFILSPEKQTRALKQWKEERTGPFAETFASLGMAYVKEDGWEDSAEFKALPDDVRTFIQNPRVPHVEYILAAPLVAPNYNLAELADKSFIGSVVILMNPQSRGSISLSSSSPEAPPLIDLAYLTHPYDKFSAITGLRHLLKVSKTKAMQKYYTGPINVPKSESDEDLLAFFKENITPIWHANGSVMMGECVDKDLAVLGMESLRVADLSVCPVMINGHTQSTAYLVGWMCGEKVIEKWGL